MQKEQEQKSPRRNPSPKEVAKILSALPATAQHAHLALLSKIGRLLPTIAEKLGPEAAEAVLTMDPERQLHIDSAEILLAVPAAVRAEAVQLVLYPDFQVMPLEPEAARSLIQKCVLEPAKFQTEWAKHEKATRRNWIAALRKHLKRSESDQILLRLEAWVSPPSGYTPAATMVPEIDRPPGAPRDLTWAQWAVHLTRTDFPAHKVHQILITPSVGEGGAGSTAWVYAPLMRLAKQEGFGWSASAVGRKAKPRAPLPAVIPFKRPRRTQDRQIPAKPNASRSGWVLELSCEWPICTAGRLDESEMAFQRAADGGCQWHEKHGAGQWKPIDDLPDPNHPEILRPLQRGWLRAVRSGLTWSEIADQIGVNKRTWENMEQGRTALTFATAFLIHQRRAAIKLPTVAAAS